MKLTVFINKELEEEIVVYAHEKTKLVEAIEQLMTDDANPIIGYKEKEAVNLKPSDIHCLIVEENKVFALTDSEKLQLKSRLYKIEERLPKSFVKINQSAVANIEKMERFSTSLSGTLMVRFKNGYNDYVSRRNLKNVKERLGL